MNMTNEIHAVGNGRIIGYCLGPDINELLSPCYSAPSICSIKTAGAESFITIRQPETDIYHHISPSAELCDVLLPEKPVFIRSITGTASFTISIPDYIKVVDISARFGDITLQFTTMQGTAVYNTYPAPDFIYNALIMRGTGDNSDGLVCLADNNNKINIDITDGMIIAVGGKSYPELIDNIKNAAACSFNTVKAEREADWKSFFERTVDFKTQFGSIPMRDDLLAAIESVKIAIRVQQDASGGEIAGYPYHLGYVRDNYGVMRGMLSLGMIEEAERLLRYFSNEFRYAGYVSNAHGLGFNGIKHVHENDCSEITGYLTLMLSDILDYIPESRQAGLVAETLPMLEWALSEQCSNVLDGMLPFNGDETYIAGGILPRDVINHGSAEATLLFIEGAKRLFAVVDRLNLSFRGNRSFYEQTLNTCERLYRNNFLRQDTLITNNPDREINNRAAMPHFRHGVCEGYCGHFGWNERLHSLYLCPTCQVKELKSNKPSGPNHKIYKLKSVLLMPLFINSTLVSISDIKNGIDEAVSDFDNKGLLPSRPDGSRCLGYDYGFLLGAMTKSGADRVVADKLYRLTLNVSKNSMVWSEYYEDNKPSGTRYRPWESGINIAALIEYALNYKSL